jgi:hypothetical protein
VGVRPNFRNILRLNVQFKSAAIFPVILLVLRRPQRKPPRFFSLEGETSGKQHETSPGHYRQDCRLPGAKPASVAAALVPIEKHWASGERRKQASLFGHQPAHS